MIDGAPRSTAAGTDTLPDVSLAAQVAADIRSGSVELPVLPEVAIRVRELVAQDGHVTEIVEVIEREPAFAAAVLRYANSVAFAGLKEIVDLRHAVTRLGLMAVEQTIIAIAAQNAFKPTDAHDARIFRMLWDHSLTTGLAARRLAGRASGLSPELTFLGGLLHDVGKVVVLRSASNLRRRDPARFKLSDQALFEFFDTLHCTAGEELFNSWHLPHEIGEVVRRHHDPKLSLPQDALILVVAFADKVAAKLGASLAPDPSLSLLETKAAEALRLDDLYLANLLVDVEDDIQRVRDNL